MRRFVGFGLAALVISTGGAARAAVLDGIQGAVLVNAGGGYRAVKRPMQLKPGYAVKANRDGRAIVTYADGCNVNVEPGSVVSVRESSPCAAPRTSNATGATGSINGGSLLGYQANGGGGGIDGATIAAGAVVVAGVGAGVYLITRDDDDDNHRRGSTLPPLSGGNPPSQSP